MRQSLNTKLSLIIPCYNETNRITHGLTETTNYLRQQPYLSEIIFVDDGSTDETLSNAQKLLKSFSTKKIIQLPRNRGKGAAIRAGMLEASGQFLVFIDIDLSTPLTELPRLLDALRSHKVAIGIRRHPKARVTVHQPKLREFLGHIFTKLVTFLVVPGIYDATCGFKGFQKNAAKELFSKSRLNAWAFDAEILFLARQKGYAIAQIPVVWQNNPATKVHILRDSFQALMDVFSIRLNHLRGVYT
ncbi:glycosyltransferase family 2 protein [Candidatus Microgenomates bacterium]|nr:MAG: glycosyltransferase family 2 protein [Candidatus Microgenomates bacterium]